MEALTLFITTLPALFMIGLLVTYIVLDHNDHKIDKKVEMLKNLIEKDYEVDKMDLNNYL